MDLTGKTAVVTGAGGGLGRVICDVFVAAGANLVACDASAELLAPLSAVKKYQFDLSNTESVLEIARKIQHEVATVDIVVNNAGWSCADAMRQVDQAIIEREIAINLTGAISFTHALLPSLRQSGGSLVFISSIDALLHFGNPVYSAAKAGILAWMRAIAVEEAQYGIRANAVCPGSIHTPAWDDRFKKIANLKEQVSSHYPINRLVKVEEVVDAVLFLACDRACGINGVSLAVDGGISAGNLPFINTITGS